MLLHVMIQQPDMLAEVHSPIAIPLEHSFFYAPAHGGQQEILAGQKIDTKDCLLFRGKELIHDTPDLGHGHFYIHPYPAVAAYDRRRIVAAMRNGKMIARIRQERLARIGYLHQLIGKVRKKELQQEAPGQVLQPFVGMRDVAVLGHIAPEESFKFFYLPHAEPGGLVDLLLKKNRH